MKVCIVTPEFPLETSKGRGGVGTYSETLAKALLSRGVDVHVVIYNDKPLSQPLRSVLPLKLHFIHLPWVRYFSSYFPGLWQSVRLRSFLRKLDKQQHFDVFEMYNDEGVTLFPVMYFKRRTAFRMHTSIRQHIVHKGEAFNSRRNFTVWLDKRAARAAAHLVTHSNFHSAEMAAEYGLELSRFTMIPHCTQPDWAPVSGRAVAYVGSLDRRKGVDVFLEAVPRILASCPDAKVLVIGRDNGFSKWFGDRFGDDTRVTFTGAVSDQEIQKLWARIGILVVPSRYESFGLTVIEGFSRGKAVVAARSAALPEVAQDGAVLVEPGDPAAIAVAVTGLLNDRDRAAALAARGYDIYEKSYTLDVFADRIMTLYSAIATS